VCEREDGFLRERAHLIERGALGWGRRAKADKTLSFVCVYFQIIIIIIIKN